MSTKRVLLALLPFVALGVASGAGAAQRLAVKFVGDGQWLNGQKVYDCDRRDSNGNMDQVSARAYAIDSCGNDLGNAGGTVVATRVGTGASQSKLLSSSVTGPCGGPDEHVPYLMVTRKGRESFRPTPGGSWLSGCWNTDFDSSDCSGWSDPVFINFATLNNGVCAEGEFQAQSYGATE